MYVVSPKLLMAPIATRCSGTPQDSTRVAGESDVRAAALHHLNCKLLRSLPCFKLMPKPLRAESV
eukprot:2472027-Karenia_brevis.AAC.1